MHTSQHRVFTAPTTAERIALEARAGDVTDLIPNLTDEQQQEFIRRFYAIRAHRAPGFEVIEAFNKLGDEYARMAGRAAQEYDEALASADELFSRFFTGIRK